MEGFILKLLSHRKSFSLFALFSMILLTVLIFVVSIHTADAQKGIAASTPQGQTLYTQFSFFYENNCHQTTNYRIGILVPVNTEVKFVKANSKNIVVTLPDGQDLTILNIEGFSGEKIDAIFTRTLATKLLDLSPFTEIEKQAIRSGLVKRGMSKPAVIAALGYPPKHKTPNLEMNQWRYWQNRYGTFVVHFEKEQVTLIED